MQQQRTTPRAQTQQAQTQTQVPAQMPARRNVKQHTWRELLAMAPAVRSRELMKKRVAMHSVRAALMRENALMMAEMTAF